MDWSTYVLNNEKLINLISNIFTSIGTVGTVIVALYLAYKSNYPRSKIRAKADFNYYHNHDDTPGTDGLPVICVDIATVSAAPIEVNAFGWVLGFSRRFLRKKIMYQLPNDLISDLSPKLPTVIPFGQNSQYFIKEDVFITNAIKSFPTNKCNLLNKFNVYFCYLFIQDSLGNFYYIRLRKKLRNHILTAIPATKKDL